MRKKNLPAPLGDLLAREVRGVGISVLNIIIKKIRSVVILV